MSQGQKEIEQIMIKEYNKWLENNKHLAVKDYFKSCSKKLFEWYQATGVLGDFVQGQLEAYEDCLEEERKLKLSGCKSSIVQRIKWLEKKKEVLAQDLLR